MYIRRAFASAACMLLAACAFGTKTIMSHYVPLGQASPQRTILISIDGTGNDMISRTNASQLYELATNQNRENLAAFYAQGVGSDENPLGKMMGTGLSQDIRQAYGFLAAHWTPDSKIYLTGFSRGAYSVRALAGMVLVAGIVDLSGLDAKERRARVDRLFEAYAAHRLKGETRLAYFQRISDRVSALGYRRIATGSQVKFATVAVWDTVAALYVPDRSDNPFEEEPWFVISNCNAENVFHALAIDDNRAYSFTPLTVLREEPDPLCPDARPRVEEVWFSGAHADVGGSYTVDNYTHGYLQGVSMRWMLSRLAGDGLLPPNTSVFADTNGPIHNAKDYIAAYKVLYYRWRDPYYLAEHAFGEDKPVLHRSVVDRLKHLKLLDDTFAECRNRSIKPKLLCASDLRRMTFLSQSIDRQCLLPTADGYRLNPARDCFTIVDDNSYFDPVKGSWQRTVSPAAL